MNINNILNDENFVEDFFKFSTSQNSRPVVVSWNGTGIHTITGPTPFVDITKTFNTNAIGSTESIVHNINLTGKIFPTGKGGISNIVSGIVALENLFKTCVRAPLEIKCDNTVIFSASGVKVTNMSFNKTNDNWVQSADYTVDLEYKTGITEDISDQVEDRQEAWTIEPLDDAVFTKFSKSVSQKGEYNNPKLKPTSASFGGQVPGNNVNGPAGNTSIQIFNIPQFRITRRLSAKGVRPPPLLVAPGQCVTASEDDARRKATYLSAKAWVDKQIAIPFNGSTITGSVYFTSTPTEANPKTWLYNHTRSVNFDIYNGTYETSDTWIAMPTGVPYTETFTVESSTDISYLKTVTVAGTIQGLALSPPGMRTGADSPISTGTTTTYSTNRTSQIDLGYSLQYPETKALQGYNVPSVTPDTTSEITQIKSAKYLNALDGWIKDVKPYLYRRACMIVNSEERTTAPYRDPTRPPPNPTYINEILLNINPVSTTEGHDPIKGTISYSHQFTNALQLISGVISENIQITNTAPVNNIQEIQVIGRALGPIIYSAGATNPKKSITVDIVVPKEVGVKATLQTQPECPLYYLGYFWKTVDEIIQGNAPFANRTSDLFAGATSQQFGTVFKDSDTETWNPTDGKYNRSVSWTYQQCTTDRFYLDH